VGTTNSSEASSLPRREAHPRHLITLVLLGMDDVLDVGRQPLVEGKIAGH